MYAGVGIYIFMIFSYLWPMLLIIYNFLVQESKESLLGPQWA